VHDGRVHDAPGPAPARPTSDPLPVVAAYLRRLVDRVVPDTRSVAEVWDPEGRLARELTATPAARLTYLGRPDAATAAPDLLVGIAPWGMRPRTAVMSPGVRLDDESSHLDLLRACLDLGAGGHAAVVVGMNFIATHRRRTVCANLCRFGLRLAATLMLPRGLFVPDSGAGRLLVVISPGPGAPPVIGSLTRDPRSLDRAFGL
jgi:hypothetical protein